MSFRRAPQGCKYNILHDKQNFKGPSTELKNIIQLCLWFYQICIDIFEPCVSEWKTQRYFWTGIVWHLELAEDPFNQHLLYCLSYFHRKINTNVFVLVVSLGGRLIVQDMSKFEYDLTSWLSSSKTKWICKKKVSFLSNLAKKANINLNRIYWQYHPLGRCFQFINLFPQRLTWIDIIKFWRRFKKHFLNYCLHNERW